MMRKLERIHLMSSSEMLQPLRHFVQAFSHRQEFDDEFKDNLVMAINEACMNVIQHAYGENVNEEIVIEFWQAEKELVVKIFDYAKCVDIEKIKSRDLKDVRPGGLGVHMIHELMDSVVYENDVSGKGNLLELRKYL